MQGDESRATVWSVLSTPGVLGGMMESVPTSPTLTKVSTKLDPMTCFFALVLMPSCVHSASCHAQVKEQYFFQYLDFGDSVCQSSVYMGKSAPVSDNFLSVICPVTLITIGGELHCDLSMF